MLSPVGPNAYKLELPPQLAGKMHSVFHVSLIEPYNENSISDRETPPPPPVDDDLDFYEVEAVLDSKTKNCKVEYLVQWTGYGPDERTWEPLDHLLVDGDYPLVRKFHKDNPTKAKDRRVKL